MLLLLNYLLCYHQTRLCRHFKHPFTTSRCSANNLSEVRGLHTQIILVEPKDVFKLGDKG
jgi:hypothetical protein